MAWRIEISETAKKQLAKLDKQAARRIISFLRDRIGRLDDPRSIGEPLKGSVLGNFWRYRVGDYRIIVSIEHHKLLVLVLALGDRKDVYLKAGRRREKKQP